MTDPYEVLGIDQGADLQRVQEAFREQARENHPDLGGDREAFMQVRRAYEQLNETLQESGPRATASSTQSEGSTGTDESGQNRLRDGSTNPPTVKEETEDEAEGLDTRDDEDTSPETPPKPEEVGVSSDQSDGDYLTSSDTADTDVTKASSPSATTAIEDDPHADTDRSTKPSDVTKPASTNGSDQSPTEIEYSDSDTDDEPAPEDDQRDAVDDDDGPTPAQEVTASQVPDQEFFWDRDIEPIDAHIDTGHRDAANTGIDSDLDHLDRKINEWKSQLLDLTRRNDLVHLVDPPKTKSLPLDEDNPTIVANGAAKHGTLTIRKRTEEAISEKNEHEDSELVPIDEPREAKQRLHDIRLNHKQHLRERGVDSLYLALGTLRWFSLEDADKEYRSPLFLLPVELEERPTTGSDSHNFVVEVPTGELIVNPALRKKLLTEWGLALPANEELSLFEIDTAFESVYHVVSGFERWVIEGDVVLGIFDFTKLSLYNDLEENRERIKEHPIVRTLVGDMGALQEAEGDIDTPTASELEDAVDPADTYQVLDADSSQQEAIEAANRGKSIVLQGPPGTGKSQTIANIIAEKLARGETVLFVSEKQAALNVVKNRLDDVGIGRFCLEAHGTKASKHSVLSSLESEVQGPRIKAPDTRSGTLETLQDLRETMREYGETLHQSPDEWDLTVYEAIGLVSAHDDLPRVETGIEDALGVGQDTVDDALEALDALGEFENEIAHHHSHPWRHTTLTEVPVDLQSVMAESIDEQIAVLREIQRHVARLEKQYDIAIHSIAQYRDVLRLLQTLEERPQIDWDESYLDSANVDEIERVETMADLARRRIELWKDLDVSYRQSLFKLDGAALYDRISEFGISRFVRPAYRSLRSKVLDHAREAYTPSHDVLREDLRTLSEHQRLEERLERYTDLCDRLGVDYRSDRVDWDELVVAIRWGTTLLEHPKEFLDPVRTRLVDGSISTVTEDSSRAEELLTAYESAAEFFEAAMDTDRMRVNGDGFDDADFDPFLDRLEELRTRVDELPSRIQYENRLQAVRQTVARHYIDRYLAEWHSPSTVVDCFEKAFYTQWLNEIYDDVGLGSFSSADMNRTVRKFRRLDRKQMQLASIAIQHEVTGGRPALSLQNSPSSEQQIVHREIRKQRNQKPLRELFGEAGSYVERLTPCFMMSPLSVAQYLTTDSIQFDTVIFDEASQIMPQDAISSIIRADQVIVGGDSKQLPPTSFFESNTETTEDVREDLESILKELAAVLPEKHLRWHYRSRTQELIQFSNQTYYDGNLQVFPENDPNVETGISYVFVEDGVYDRGGTRQNESEATRVVDEIQEHAHTYPEKSLGVVAFSKAQEQAIRDELNERIADAPVLEAFVNEDDILDEFFIKNLEMVQGDERDRMLFSVGYGPDRDGELTMNFGPLNQSGGERRLNVAVTRAREMITVVSSIQPEEIDLDRTSSRGVADFKAYLEYAKQASDNRIAKPVGNPEEFESPFERSVYATLEDTDMHIERVGAKENYSLDFGIKKSADAEAYALGIQCDGAAYRHSKTTRDRERTRPSVLSDLGWNIHRVWSPSWVINPERELERIHRKVFDDREGDNVDEVEYGNFPVPVEDQSPVTEEISGKPLALETMVRYEAPKLPALGGRLLDDIPPETLWSDLKRVVTDHGPLREDVAYRAVLAQWDITRLDESARETMSACANLLEQHRELVVCDGFLWPLRETLDFSVRLPDDSERRDFDQIPLEELLLAMSVILDHGGTMEAGDLQLEIARLYGYQRRGSRIRSRLDRAVRLGEECGILGVDDRVALVENEEVEAAILKRVYR